MALAIDALIGEVLVSVASRRRVARAICEAALYLEFIGEEVDRQDAGAWLTGIHPDYGDPSPYAELSDAMRSQMDRAAGDLGLLPDEPPVIAHAVETLWEVAQTISEGCE